MKQDSPTQFALFRLLFGVYLTWRFAVWFTWEDASWLDAVWFGGTIFASVCFTFGMVRRLAALWLLISWTLLDYQQTLIASPSHSFVELLLFACALSPTGEGWSLHLKQKRHWQIPTLVFYGTWLVMALRYTVSGISMLQTFFAGDGSYLTGLSTWMLVGVEIAFAPLCFFDRGRMLASALMVVLYLSIALLGNFAYFTLDIMMVHLFTIDPRWLRRKPEKEKILVFYDGECGVCNRFVQFLLGEDPERLLRYAPLQGETARQLLPEKAYLDLDSVAVIMDGKLYRKSTAILRVGRQLGGVFWLASGLMVIPRPIRDFVYDLFARHRHRMVAACLLPDAEERRLFLP